MTVSKRDRSCPRAVDAGITLIELLIYSVLSIVVLLIVGGVLTNTFTTERTVRGSTQASNAGQLVANSVGHGVRNASAIWHSATGVVPELLMVRTVGSGATAVWSCQAWSFGDGEVRTTNSPTAISTTQSAATVKSWTLLGEGMQSVSAPPAAVFAVSGAQVDLTLEVRTGDAHQPVLIRTSSVSRQPNSATGSPPCF